VTRAPNPTAGDVEPAAGVSVCRRAEAGEGGPAQPLRSPRGFAPAPQDSGHMVKARQGRGRRAVRYDAARTVGRHDRLQLPVTIYTTPRPARFPQVLSSVSFFSSKLRHTHTHTEISFLATTFD
jgi:hypothetical protein